MSFLLEGHHCKASNCAIELHLFAYLLSATCCVVMLPVLLGGVEWERESRKVYEAAQRI